MGCCLKRIKDGLSLWFPVCGDHFFSKVYLIFSLKNGILYNIEVRTKATQVRGGKYDKKRLLFETAHS